MWTIFSLSVCRSLAGGLLILGVTNSATASVPLTVDVSDGYTFSGVQRTTKTGALEFFAEQAIGPFAALVQTKAMNADSKNLVVEGQVIIDATTDPPTTKPFAATVTVKIEKEKKEKKKK
ncbi:MAG: hypothetical protein AB7G75_25315 [Candidatus Binatia bacterium]